MTRLPVLVLSALLLALVVGSEAPKSENFNWIHKADDIIEIRPRSTPRGTLIYLHGAFGDSPMLTVLRFWGLYGGMRMQHIKVLLPRAPLRRHSASGGMPGNIWFDRDDRNIASPEKRGDIKKQAKRLSKIVYQEIAQGTAIGNIVIGGFSLGGAMALHLCLRYFPNAAGCSAEGSFLSSDSAVYQDLDADPSLRRPPVLLQNGQRDRITTLQNALHTYNQLKQRGLNVTLVVHQRQGHVPCKKSAKKPVPIRH